MLWVYQNPCHFSARGLVMSMTLQFQECKTEIVARHAKDLISSVPQAAAAETLIQDFEKRFI